MAIHMTHQHKGTGFVFSIGTGYASGLVLPFDDPTISLLVAELEGDDALSHAIKWGCEHWHDIQQSGIVAQYEEERMAHVYVQDQSDKVLLALLDNPFIPEHVLQLGRDELSKRERRKPTTGTIYLIQGAETGYTKIGITKDIQRRLKTLQISSPEHLQVAHSFPGTAAEERSLHRSYQDKRLHGEWFSLSQNDIQAITACYPDGPGHE